jgi:polar amino acid transport system substrate-binding protein
MTPRRRLAALLFALASLLPLPAAAGRDLVLAATEYPPYTSEALEQGGPMSQIAIAALQHAGYGVRLRFLPWARALRLAEQGEVDGLLAVWHSPERERSFWFSRPVVSNRLVLCGREAHMPRRFDGFAALHDYTLGVVRGYAKPAGLDAANLTVEEATDDLQNLRKLVADRVDLVLIDGRVERFLVSRHMPESAPALRCLQPPVQEPPLYLVVSRRVPDGQDVMQAFDAQLATMVRDGEYAAISERWNF